MFMAILFAAQAHAQTVYEWDDFGLKFTVPPGFKETANNDEKFEGESARAKITLFGLYPLADENVTEQNTMQAVKAMAAEAGMDKSTLETGKIEFNGFKGAYAEGTINGHEAFFAVMLDPESDLNFIVSVIHDNADAAIALVKSIKKM